MQLVHSTAWCAEKSNSIQKN